MIDDTIVAQATPSGKSGVCIIRLSGKKSLEISRHIFSAFSNPKETQSNFMYLGKIDLGETKDKGFLVYFKKPNSFTGEDIIEFHCHGGQMIAQKIIERCLYFKARLAEPGEFSKRAFLNGKMSLDQAEGIVDTINAETEAQLKAGSELVNGNLFKISSEIQKTLTDLLAEIEVNLDYPEHDIEYETKETIKKKILEVKTRIQTLLDTEEKGKLIKNGINVAIIGKTNVGKSSLMNAIVGKDQAIVTNIEGTTRDVVSASIEFKGLKFNFFDTAGIRQTTDFIEKIGVKKSKQTIKESDIVVLVLDNSKEFSIDDHKNLNLIKNKKTVIVLNKCDLPQKMKVNIPTIKISAQKKLNIDELKEKIYDTALQGINTNSQIILTNTRHKDILKQAKEIIEICIKNIENLSLDCVALDVKQLWQKLGEITGETADEEVINKIFSKFCLGK